MFSISSPTQFSLAGGALFILQRHGAKLQCISRENISDHVFLSVVAFISVYTQGLKGNKIN